METQSKKNTDTSYRRSFRRKVGTYLEYGDGPVVDQKTLATASKRIWEHIENRLRNETSRTRRMRMLMKAAALFLMLAVPAYYFFLYRARAPLAARNLTAISLEAQVKKIILADGTTVWLNASSAFSYPKNFEGRFRRVTLNGEGYFEVAKDKKHPFIIDAGGIKVQVVGTSFDVKSYASEKRALVNVLTGLVKVIHAGQQVSVSPGHEAVYEVHTHALVVKDRQNVEEANSWKNGEIIFHENDMNEVAGILKRRCGLFVKYDPIFSSRAVYGNYTGKSVKEIVKLLSISLGAEGAIKGNNIIFYNKH